MMRVGVARREVQDKSAPFAKAAKDAAPDGIFASCELKHDVNSSCAPLV